MNLKEIKEAKEEQIRIKNMSGDKQEERNKALDKLASKVGASTINRYHGHGRATEAEIFENINNALQTETMIAVCKIAVRNFWITMVAAIAAVLSALAAWSAIVK
ncbi:MAG: hypothetical protein JXB29_07760 [Sedimentisphaerales bacterium]|nr:hypothetical protein [Sedimentisphaerales bacterium]